MFLIDLFGVLNAFTINPNENPPRQLVRIKTILFKKRAYKKKYRALQKQRQYYCE